MAARIVKISVPEDVAAHIERLEKKSLQEVLEIAWSRYVDDSRRTQIETKRVPVSWPLDWYERMQKTWGQGVIPQKVRLLLYKDLNTNPQQPLTPPPEWKDLDPVKKSTKVKPGPDRNSYVQAVLIPMDWYVRLLERVGDGWASTYIKYLVWLELNTSRAKLSVPPRMNRFQ